MMPKSDLRLIEYQEVLAERRHYDVLRWTVVGLAYPSAFAAIAFAGTHWGFMSGRVFCVGTLGTLWLIAGSLVFAQIHFYGQARMSRAWEIENELGFTNLCHKPFEKPEVPNPLPFYTMGLAWWFATFFPVLVLMGSLYSLGMRSARVSFPTRWCGSRHLWCYCRLGDPLHCGCYLCGAPLPVNRNAMNTIEAAKKWGLTHGLMILGVYLFISPWVSEKLTGK